MLTCRMFFFWDFWRFTISNFFWAPRSRQELVAYDLNGTNDSNPFGPETHRLYQFFVMHRWRFSAIFHDWGLIYVGHPTSNWLDCGFLHVVETYMIFGVFPSFQRKIHIESAHETRMVCDVWCVFPFISTVSRVNDWMFCWGVVLSFKWQTPTGSFPEKA